MHGDASPRKTPDAPSGSGVRRKSGVPVGSGVPVAFATLIVANVALAFGPWFVRAADTGPVAAAFWRIALAAPMLAVLAGAGGAVVACTTVTGDVAVATAGAGELVVVPRRRVPASGPC